MRGARRPHRNAILDRAVVSRSRGVETVDLAGPQRRIHLVELDALLNVDLGHRGAVDQDDDLRLRGAAGKARQRE